MLSYKLITLRGNSEVKKLWGASIPIWAASEMPDLIRARNSCLKIHPIQLWFRARAPVDFLIVLHWRDISILLILVKRSMQNLNLDL